MNLLDLMVKIGVDDQASSKIKGITDGIKGGMGKAAQVGGAALKAVGVASAAATAAVGAFGVSSVKTGMEFDSAMSQVAATMGTTVDQIGELRDFAQEMGSTTSFSASQAAEALNYMALAGYDADQSMNMLPNVLNLAAAGGIELAEASDMVTDAQSALGLSAEKTTDMVDQMAAASSKTNTSVAQLGQAFLTVGGTAKNLKGGTVELSQALGLLADNGVKGAEGGTALRNVLLGMSSEKFDQSFGALGVSAYDAEGNMRSLKDVFADMNGVMADMTVEEKTKLLSEAFNKVDLKSLNALLGTDAERWDEVEAAISDSTDAAQQMADTQLDNLSGDLTILQSAWEGLQIAISDGVSPALRDVVQLATETVSGLTEAFKSGNLEAIPSLLSGALQKGLALLSANLPSMISMGAQLVVSLALGLAQALPGIASAIVQSIPLIANTLIANAPQIKDAGVQLFNGLGQALGEVAAMLAEALGYVITHLPEIVVNGIGGMIEGGKAFFGGIVDGFLGKQPEVEQAAGDIASSAVDAAVENSDASAAADKLADSMSKYDFGDAEAAAAKATENLAQTAAKSADGKPIAENLTKTSASAIDMAAMDPNARTMVENAVKAGEAVDASSVGKAFSQSAAGGIDTSAMNAGAEQIAKNLKGMNQTATVSVKADLSGVTQLRAAASSVTTAYSTMANSVTGAMSRASAATSSAAQSIRRSIDAIPRNKEITVTFNKPHIPVPHWSMSGSFDPKTGSTPTVSTWWGAFGGILTKATIFGAGEAGPEAVLPLNRLGKMLDDSNRKYSGGDVYNIYLPSMSDRGYDEVAMAITDAIERRNMMRGRPVLSTNVRYA